MLKNLQWMPEAKLEEYIEVLQAFLEKEKINQNTFKENAALLDCVTLAMESINNLIALIPPGVIERNSRQEVERATNSIGYIINRLIELEKCHLVDTLLQHPGYKGLQFLLENKHLPNLLKAREAAEED